MLDSKILHSAVRSAQMIWRRHALERMLSRNVSRDEAKEVLLRGEQIEDYTDDFPFPSGLFLANITGRDIHVVAGLDKRSGTVYVISVYEPDNEHFEADKRTRRQKS